MKKTVLIATAALVLASCGQKKSDPVKDAITQYVSTNVSEDYTKFSFNTIEKIDSTTFREEFEHRKKAFEARRASDEKFILKYTQEGKQKNAILKTESFRNTLRIISGLDSLENVSSAILDDVAYYDYKFSGVATGSGARLDFTDAYVTVTPDYQILSMTTNQKDLHKSTGRVIPGYLDVVKGEDEESSDEVEE